MVAQSKRRQVDSLVWVQARMKENEVVAFSVAVIKEKGVGASNVGSSVEGSKEESDKFVA